MNYLTSLYTQVFKTDASEPGFERESLLVDAVSWLPGNKNARILNVECGSGDFLLVAKAEGYEHVFGIDSDADRVEAARRQGLSNVEVAKPNDYLENNAGSFDCIVVLDLVERLSGTEAAALLKSVRSALKPGGRVVVRTRNADAPMADDANAKLSLNARTARELLENNGFTAAELVPAHMAVEGLVRTTLYETASTTARVASLVARHALGRSTPVIVSPRLVASAVRTPDAAKAQAPSQQAAQSAPAPEETPREPEVEEARSDNAIRFSVNESTLGRVLVAATSKGVCAVLIGDDAAELEEDLKKRFPDVEFVEPDEKFDAMAARVVAHVDASNEPVDIPLDLHGTEFQTKVWNALREIPAGSTETYSEVAARVGMPKSAMAIASACASNAVAVVIPCHRVVRADGGLSGYRWGVERKRALIDREANG